MSTIQIKPKLIAKLKSPKVRILKGRVNVFKIGLTKELINPRIIPKSSKTCQELVKGMPKKLESG